jgi:hypothetical protein
MRLHALRDPSADLRPLAEASSERPSEFPICDMMAFAKLIMAVNHSEIKRKLFKQIRYVQLVRTIGPRLSDLGASSGGGILRI